MDVGGERLQRCKLDHAEIFPTELCGTNIVTREGSPEKSDDEPPAAVLSNLDPEKREAFLRMRNNILVRLRAIHFDFEGNLWTTDDIDSLGNLLNKYGYRVSKHGSDLWDVSLLILLALS